MVVRTQWNKGYIIKMMIYYYHSVKKTKKCSRLSSNRVHALVLFQGVPLGHQYSRILVNDLGISKPHPSHIRRGVPIFTIFVRVKFSLRYLTVLKPFCLRLSNSPHANYDRSRASRTLYTSWVEGSRGHPREASKLRWVKHSTIFTYRKSIILGLMEHRGLSGGFRDNFLLQFRDRYQGNSILIRCTLMLWQ